jgi:ATP-dependent RNA helicase DeaD
MAETDFAAIIGPELASAIAGKGYTTLTLVQEAVLAPELEGRDLRISSQTGSGKTIAIGFTVRDMVKGESASTPKGAARPRALVIAPTRELAKQVELELSWLYAPMRISVASVTGGGNFRDERRALGSNPGIVVGTPGRLLDHLTRGSIDGTNLGAVVLDEADRMLDLGFRDDLEAILKFAPESHRTHLVSATFPREVMALANRVQKDPARIEGTPLGTANTDIEHLVHLVLPHERLDAIVNLMLETPGQTTLIFARTRADVGELSRLLSDAGFVIDSLSGEMEQRERNKALAAFKRGDLDALVATDVAARGIDVQDVARVLHAEPPMDADAYTHRSGRTGRAGRKGKSSVLVVPPALTRVSSLLKRAGVRWRIDPVPTAETIEAAREERLYADLTRVIPPDDPAEDPVPLPEGFIEADDRSWALAKRIADAGEATRSLARMIARTRSRGPEARRITPINAPQQRKKPWEERQAGPGQGQGQGQGPQPSDRSFGERRPFAEHRTFGEPRGLRPDRNGPPEGYPDARDARPAREPGPPRTARDAATDAGSWVSFRVSWGQIHGADARRLLAMVCRRGGIRGSDVGSIRVTRTFSTVDVSAAAAQTFERATREPDPRDPKVRIRPASEVEHGGPPANQAAETDRPSKTADRASKTADRASKTDDRPSKTADRASKTDDRSSTTADRPSKTADRPSTTADRPSKANARTLEAERPSRTAERLSDAERPSRTSTRSVVVEAERPSKSSVRTLEAERPSKTAERASEAVPAAKSSARIVDMDTSSFDPETERTAKSSARIVDTERPSKAARDAERAAQPATPERSAPPERASRSAYADRRPRPSSPERYSRRPAPDGAQEGPRSSNEGPRPSNDRPRPFGEVARPAYRPSNDGPRPSYDRTGRPTGDGPRPNDRPRPSNEGPPSRDGRPSYDRNGRPTSEGPRPNDRPRPSSEGPPSRDGRPSYDRNGRPTSEGPRPSDRGRPSNEGPRPAYDRGRPSNDGPRTSNDRPRPHPGARPSGPPSRHGDARPKRKKP